MSNLNHSQENRGSAATESDSNGASMPPSPNNRSTGGQRPRRLKRTRPMPQMSHLTKWVLIAPLLLLQGITIDINTPNMKIHFQPQQSEIVLVCKMLWKQEMWKYLFSRCRGEA